ncbi:MAG: hypothetical protein GU362_00050 [Thaumarchaeota archaeon]|nr:hypothetical protein [Nitrososphaerota archaeon]
MKGLWLIVYEYPSRFIVDYGIYTTPKSKYSVDLLKKAIEKPRRFYQIKEQLSIGLKQMKGRKDLKSS